MIGIEWCIMIHAVHIFGELQALEYWGIPSI